MLSWREVIGPGAPRSMSEPVRFLLNGQRIDVGGLSPQTTLLEYLREVRRLTGTKEGCAEGDCGACTVVLAEPAGDRLTWKPVNACIRLLPSVDGKAVFTVESLAGDDGIPHPLQRALGIADHDVVATLNPATPERILAAIDDLRRRASAAGAGSTAGAGVRREAGIDAGGAA